MGMIGTFDGFTASRLGIYAAQQALRVTGNNISNISTSGYTRQRVDQMSFKVGANDMYRSYYDNHIGSGALVTGINQIRDPYLDIRYRTTSTETYHYDTWLSGLQEIASILDEVGKGENYGDGLLYKQLQDMAEKLRSFSANPTSSNDGLVRESANALASLFRNYANRLQELYDGAKAKFENSISDVNDILTTIRDLNKSIRDAEIHGDTALEMRDERNRQIDELSKYIGIKVEYSYEDVGAGIQVEKLTIKLNNKNPDPNVSTDESVLVDGLYATQLSVPEKLPQLNAYSDGEQYAYLKGYRYLAEFSPTDLGDFQNFVNQINESLGLTAGDPGYLTADDLLTGTDADGNTIYYYGTNDMEEAAQVDNDNFTIQLEKLLDAKGREWKNTTTRWSEVTGTTTLTNAQFAYTVSGENLTDGATFKIAGTTYTVGDTTAGNTISLADAQDPAKFAKFVADHLDPDNYPGYTISSNEDGQVVFTATGTGVPDTGKIPVLSVSDPDNTGWLTVGDMKTLNPGYTVGPPDPANMADAGETVDAFGNVIQSVKYVESNGKWYRIQVDTEYTYEVTLDDNDLRGILQAQRELLTEEGEFSSDYDVFIDEQAAIKRGIPYYQQALDLLAQKFAEAYNELNQGYMVDKDGYYITETGEKLVLPDILDADNPGYVSAEGLTEGQRQNLINNGYVDENGEVDLDRWLEEHGAVFMGGPLFSNGNNGDDTTGITAKNIDISAGWSHGKWGLVPKFEKIFVDENNPDGLEQSTQNTNADRMLALINKSLKYNPNDLNGSDATGPLLFEGSFNDFFSYIMSVEASDARITTSNLSTSSTSLTELDYSREGVSGVDLNDEAMNMMQFSKAMNAAMRVMTVIDEVLERLINNTGIAGR